MFDPKICPDTSNVISLQGSADGHSLHDSPAGQTNASYGQAQRRASRSRSLVKEKPKLTIGTYGPTFFDSSASVAPPSSWANRLQRRLTRVGSTECLLTWKPKDTPAKRRLFQLVPSTRPTDATEFGLWPIDQLPRQVAAALWSTPTSLAPAVDGNNEAGNSAGLVAIRGHAIAGSSDTTGKPGALNPQFVCWLMGFQTELDACAPMATRSSRKSPRK